MDASLSTSKKGYACTEVAIALPFIILLSIVVIFSITSISSEYEQIEEYNLTEDISKADSLKRKADVFFEALWE